MQSFPSLPLPAAVEIFLSYVPICIASMASQDAPPASLLIFGLYFQTLWACAEAVEWIFRLTQVGGEVIALCTGQYLCWHFWFLHALFQLVPVFHGSGCLFVCGLKILLQPLLWFGNRIPSIMGQFRGVCNRHARTAKTFPILRSHFHSPIEYAFPPTQKSILYSTRSKGGSLARNTDEEVGIGNSLGIEIWNR